MKILKKLGSAIAKALKLADAVDEKVSCGIATSLDTIANQAREYEKRFEPESPEPPQKTSTEPPFTFEIYVEGMPIAEAMARAGFSASAATYALRRVAEALNPKPRSNNWRKMHGLPMRRKMPKQRRR